MKKIAVLLTVVTVMLAVFAFASPAMAVKPAANLAGAQQVPWNLSAAVMPVPPYGSVDIPGSDTASKLIVNQPNGNTEVAITGVMRGLDPLTTYTVFLSNGYTPYVETGWNVTGLYTIALTVGATPYTEYLTLVQTGPEITGTYLALDAAGTQSRWDILSGSVEGDILTFHAHYALSPTHSADFSATIAADGSLVDGDWADVEGGWTRSGLWSSTDGAAAKTYTGSTGWPGLFSANVPAFTFVTDEFGAGSWHVNLKDADFPGLGTYPLSVWINSGATILISDTFKVVR